MSLLALQRSFMGGLARQSAVTPWAVGDDANRFGVYRNAYRRRLGDCLRESFAKTLLWIGDDEFDQAVDGLIDNHASTAWTLSAYGACFPAFLAARYPGDPEIAELASLEAAMRRAFDGPNAAPLSAAQVDVPDWDQAVFRFVPTFEFSSVTTNCAAIWTAIDNATEPPAATPLAEPASICVWRKGLTPCFRTIVGRERQAIAIALSGTTLEEFCRLLASPDDMNAVSDVGGLIALWIREEMLSGISAAGTDRQVN